MALVGLLVLLNRCRTVFVSILAWYLVFLMNDKLDIFSSLSIHIITQYVLLQNVSLSVNDLLACCGFLCGSGCDGGYPLYAWRYFVHHGVVTEEVVFLFQPNKIF